MRKLAVISGGPGTGKTTTVVRLLGGASTSPAVEAWRRTGIVG
jgi:ATP-dependent exoDNAse (exonuclease V) alpha subunit